MTRGTGGAAWAATSTRSRFLPYAYSRASSVVLIPSCSPSSPISLTRGTRIASLMRVWGSGRRGGSKEPLRGLKVLSPSSSCPPHVAENEKTATACSGSGFTNLHIGWLFLLNPRDLWSGGERRFRPCLPGRKGSKLRPEPFE